MMFQRDSPLSLSFSDLPISETQEITRDITFERGPVLTTPVEEFEFFFFNDLDVKTCSADDIFSQGKLQPFKSPSHNNTTTTSKGQVWDSLNINKADFFNPKGRAISHRCSAEYKRLGNDPRPAPLLPPKQVSGGTSGRSRSMPKWFLFLFGSIKMPVVMDMSDIRSRQSRRFPASFVPPADRVGEEGKSRWKFLRALSCRGHGEVGTPMELRVARVGAS